MSVDNLSHRSSTLEFENIINILRQQNNSLQLRSDQLEKELENTQQKHNYTIQNFQLQIKQKDEKLIQMEKTIEKHGNYDLIMELEQKVENLEKKNQQLESQMYKFNKMQIQNKFLKYKKSRQSMNPSQFFQHFQNNDFLSNANSTDNVNQKQRSNTLKNKELLQKFDKLDQILENKKNLQSRTSKRFDPSLNLNLNKQLKQEEENNKNLQNKSSNNKVEELVNYIKELEDLLEEERNINYDNERDFQQVKQQNDNLKNNETVLKSQLRTKEEEKAVLIMEIDNLKVRNLEFSTRLDKIQNQNEIHLKEIIKNKQKNESNEEIKKLSENNQELKQKLLQRIQVLTSLKEEKKITEFAKEKQIQNLQKELDELKNQREQQVLELSIQIKDLQQQCDNLQNEKQYFLEQSKKEIAEEQFKSQIQIEDLQKKLTIIESQQEIQNNFQKSQEISQEYEEDLNIEFNGDYFNKGSDQEEELANIIQTESEDEEQEVLKRARGSVLLNNISTNDKDSFSNLQMNALRQENQMAQERIEKLEKYLEEKESQIHDLRQKILQQKKLDDYVKKEYHEEQIKSLQMDLDHEKIYNKQQLTSITQLLQQKEQDYEDIEQNYIEIKVSMSKQLGALETKILQYKRRLRKRELEINLYKNTIDEFNKKHSN